MYIVLQRTDSVTSKGSPFCFLKVANQDEQFEVALWDTTPELPPRTGDLVAFKPAGIRERDGKKSCSRMDFTCQGAAPKGHPLYELIPRPIDKDTWQATILTLATLMTDDRERDLFRSQAELLFDKYVEKPAAKKMHHAFPGGLLNHTHQMLAMLVGLYPTLPYPKEVKIDRLALALLFHDYGKICEYDRDGTIQEDLPLLGNIYISADKLQNLMLKEGLPWDEVKRTIHIILAHHGSLEFGSPVLPATAEAVIATHLDNLSAKLEAVHAGANMEKDFCLGTNVIK